MPLTGTDTAWGNSIGDAIIAADPNAGLLTDAEKDQIRAGWRLIKGVDVPHLVANVAVGTTVAVASVSAVTPGPGVSGPGVGTGTGVIT